MFSDSTQDAAKEGRKKHTANGNKSVFHIAIAKDIFAVDHDPKLREAVATSVPEEVWKSVENFISRLKTAYKSFNAESGETGAGLECSEVVPGSKIANKIDTR